MINATIRSVMDTTCVLIFSKFMQMQMTKDILAVSVIIRQPRKFVSTNMLSQYIKNRNIPALTVINTSNSTPVCGDISSQSTMTKDILVSSVIFRQLTMEI